MGQGVRLIHEAERTTDDVRRGQVGVIRVAAPSSSRICALRDGHGLREPPEGELRHPDRLSARTRLVAGNEIDMAFQANPVGPSEPSAGNAAAADRARVICRAGHPCSRRKRSGQRSAGGELDHPCHRSTLFQTMQALAGMGISGISNALRQLGECADRGSDHRLSDHPPAGRYPAADPQRRTGPAQLPGPCPASPLASLPIAMPS